MDLQMEHSEQSGSTTSLPKIASGRNLWDLKVEHPEERGSSTSLSKIAATSIGSTAKRQGSFVVKFFIRQNLRLKERSTLKGIALRETRQEPLDDLGITPCPYVRPLGFKLEARIEPGPRNEQLTYTDLARPEDLAMEIARNRAEASRKLAGHLPGAQAAPRTMWMSRSQHMLNSQASYLLLYHSGDADVNLSPDIIRQREDVAFLAASDASNISNWKAYIRSYSEGRFNLTAPPHPPPRAGNFTFLPAVYPDDEEMRQSAGSIYDVVWPEWEPEKAGALIRAAMKKFDTRYAAISFFNGQHETFKAESGYDMGKIPRATSIAAHALLSTDVLVVLDTLQDWRFSGNPLVVEKPKIRFFAGAPMLAPGGEVVGIFAILGKQPRTTFTPFQRRDLAELGQQAMLDLNLQAEFLSDPDVRSTPILQRSSLINADTLPTTPHSPSLKAQSDHSDDSFEIDMDMLPPALHYHKDFPKPRVSRLFMSKADGRDTLEPTPPSSSGSGTLAQPSNSPRGFGKNLKQLSVNAGHDLSSFDEQITPDSACLLAPSPRPFSSSDLTSLDPHPPNTPNTSMEDGVEPIPPCLDLTIESFMSLTDLDIAEPEINPPSNPLINLESPQSRDKHASISTDISSHYSRSQRWSSDSAFMAEAAFSCSFTAQSLGYDLVYAARVRPTREPMTEEELLQPGGLTVNIIVAYGLKKRLELCAETHLRVLRSSGYETIEHVPDYKYQDDEYEVGHMIRLSDDGRPREQRRSGIVFGAFRKPRPAQLVELDTPPRASVEIQKLVTAANALNTILTKSLEREKSEKALTRPSAPNYYPANEAVEVGKSSSDA